MITRIVGIACAATLGCTAYIEGGVGTTGGPGPVPVPSTPSTEAGTSFEDAPADPLSASGLPIRLLTRVEYENTVVELLGSKLPATSLFPAESQAETGFSKVQKVDQVGVAAYLDAALTLAEEASRDLTGLLGCDPTGASEGACVQSFLGSFGRRAFRRPLRAEELAQHASFYQDVLRSELGLGVPEAVELLLAALLESPHFLYRWEQGPLPSVREGAVLKLNPHHLASQLSYFLWASMPDEPLLAAADTGQLETAPQVEQQVRRMLADKKAERTVAVFHEQWLGLTTLPKLGKSPGLYPAWSSALGSAMAEEVRRFTTNVVLHGDGRWATLLTSRASFVNGPLAELYGIAGVSGPDFVARELPGERVGLLTLAGFLSAHSGETEGSPIFRGKFLRERLLCDLMAPPPDGIPDLPPPAANLSIRDRHLEHAEVSPCKDCHLRMDFIGFGLDNFDAIGAYQRQEGQLPIDASGQVYGLDGESPTFNGPSELVLLLTQSEQVRQCLAKEWFRYAFARKEAAGDRASFDNAFAAFAKSDYDIRELLVAFAQSRSFTHRTIDAGEVFE